MIMRPASIALIVALAAVAGCKGDGSKAPKDNIDPPTELVDLVAPRNVSRLWSANVGKGARLAGANIGASVSDGKVFAANLEGQLRALNARSGGTLWQVETGIRMGGGPTAADGLVAIGTLEGQLFVFDTDGGKRWEATVSSEIVSAPAIGQGMVVVMTNDGRSYAYDAASGERRWVVDSAVPALSLRGNAQPIIGDQLTFLGQANGRVRAVNNESGETVWEAQLGDTSGRTELERMIDIDGQMMLIKGDLFAVGFGSKAQALAADSGRILWTRDLSSYTGLTLTGSALLVTTSSGEVLNLDTRSGSALWKQDALQYRFLSTPAKQDDTVVVGDFDGYLHWISIESGEIVARARPGKKGIRSAPVVADGIVYALDLDGSLSAYALGGG
ncbi:MAG: outer membrane protein assembly factor BamB [Xanthomonadales bacterium]|nr:outer membrane protein assembly factor BamB [Xanthomonadales bacterium]